MIHWGLVATGVLYGAVLLHGACAKGDRQADREKPSRGLKAETSPRTPDPDRLHSATPNGRVPSGGVDNFAALGPGATEAALRIRFPARVAEAPITVTRRDDTGPDTSPDAVRLVEVKARAVVQGPLAFTELHLVLANPENREVEAWLRVLLPPRAAVSRLAMLLPDGWEEAEVVERFRAREVYENLVSKRIDPALVEKEADDAIRLRVFPIGARGRKEVKIAWTEDLPSSRSPFRLRLKGLGKLERLDARILISAAAGATPRVVRISRTQAAPEEDLVADGAATPAMAGVRIGSLAVARVTTAGDGGRSPIASLLLLVETSAQVATSFNQAVDRASALVQALRRKVGEGFRLRVAGYDQTVGEVYRGPAEGFGSDGVRALRARMPLGRSNLEGALAWAAEQKDVDRVLLLSSVAPTTGATGPPPLAAAIKRLGPRVRRLDVALMPLVADPGLAAQLVRGHLVEDGVVLGDAERPDECARRLFIPARYDVAVTVPGAKWIWPTRVHRHQAGDDLMVFASLEGDPQDKLTVRVGEQTAAAVSLHAADEALVRRAWAGARIAELEGQLARQPPAQTDTVSAEQREIARLSREHRILSSQTALLLLETDEDYKRHAISRTALPDVLTVGESGLVLEKRRGAVAPGASKPPDSDESPSVRLRRPMGEPVGSPSRSRSVPTFGGWGGFGRGGGGGGGGGIGLGGAGGIGAYRSDEPAVFMSRATVQGGLDPETIRRVVRRRLSEVRYCYVVNGLSRIPDLRGKLVIRFTLDPNGLVDSAAVAQTTLKSEAVERCVVEAVRRWRFPKPEGSKPIVLYPFHMKPGWVMTLGTLAQARKVGMWQGRLGKLVQMARRELAVAAIPSALATLAEGPWEPTDLMILGRLAAAGQAPALAARIYGTIAENPWPSRRDSWLGAALLETLGGDWARQAAKWHRETSSRYQGEAFLWIRTMALLRLGRPAEALDLLDRSPSTSRPLPIDERMKPERLELLSLVGGVLVRREPGRRQAVEKRLADSVAVLPRKPFVLFVMVAGGYGCSPALIVQDSKDRLTHRNLLNRESLGVFEQRLSFGQAQMESYRIRDLRGAQRFHLRVGCFEEPGSSVHSPWYLGWIDVLQADSQGTVRHSSTPFFGNELKVGPLVTTVSVSP